MKKTIAILAALAAGLSMQAQEQARAYSITTDFTYASKYVFRGESLAGQSFQPSIEFSMNDFYAGIWSNMPLKDNVTNEIDFYLGYGFALQDDWKLDVGATMYYYADKAYAPGEPRETYEAYVGITGGDFVGISPSFYLYYDWKLRNTTGELSVDYSLPISQLGLSLDFGAFLGVTNNGPEEGNNTYWGLGVQVPYQLAPNAMITAGVQYATTDRDYKFSESVSDDCFYWTLSLTIGF